MIDLIADLDVERTAFCWKSAKRNVASMWTLCGTSGGNKFFVVKFFKF